MVNQAPLGGRPPCIPSHPGPHPAWPPAGWPCMGPARRVRGRCEGDCGWGRGVLRAALNRRRIGHVRLRHGRCGGNGHSLCMAPMGLLECASGICNAATPAGGCRLCNTKPGGRKGRRPASAALDWPSFFVYGRLWGRTPELPTRPCVLWNFTSYRISALFTWMATPHSAVCDESDRAIALNRNG